MIPSERPTRAPAPARPDRARVRVAAAPAPAPRALVVLAALLLALAAVLLSAGRADAHNALQGTDPADGSTVATPPARITLTFDQPAQSLGTEIVVLGPDGSTVSTGSAELVDNTVSQALAADLPAGAYSVEWRVTSADGHPLSGSLAFTASGGAAAPAAPETIEPTAGPTTTAPTEPSNEATVSATLAPQQELAEDEDAGLAAGVVAAIVVAVLAAVAIAVFVVRERRRSRDAGAGDGPSGTTGGDGRAEG